jgi:prepilin-type N-terminal cleavage/methylation domain-containing protein
MVTTSEIGDSRVRRGAGQAGFTLVEILVVLAIIVLLFSMVTVSVGTFYASAYERSTRAMVLRLREFLDVYKRLTGAFPPDGLDSSVTNQDGIELKGSAALHHFLTQPVVVKVVQGGVIRYKEYDPVASTPFTTSELSAEDPGSPGVFEILDGWGDPFHYDNTEDGEFVPQGGDVHTPPIPDEEHAPDPRDVTYSVRGEPAVPLPGEVQSKGYDLWSSAGQEPDTLDEDLNKIPIASWNIEE